ncbi:MAG: DUF2258 domain-containing protein, partial [Thermoprotei archaeon]|nr:DUF2258 domain-containing protein [Thermoprotei archaeon]
MPTLRTGLVVGGAYAAKVRKTLFAQIRGSAKGKVLKEEPSDEEIVRAAGELNRVLYEVLVDRVRIEKGDVVRVSVNYAVEEGRIRWDLETLSIQAWRRIPEQDI